MMCQGSCSGLACYELGESVSRRPLGLACLLRMGSPPASLAKLLVMSGPSTHPHDMPMHLHLSVLWGWPLHMQDSLGDLFAHVHVLGKTCCQRLNHCIQLLGCQGSHSLDATIIQGPGPSSCHIGHLQRPQSLIDRLLQMSTVM